jgi:hypothetical protein
LVQFQKKEELVQRASDQQVYEAKLESSKRLGAGDAIAGIVNQLASVSVSKVKQVELQSQQAGLTSPKPSSQALAKLESIGLQARALRPRK